MLVFGRTILAGSRDKSLRRYLRKHLGITPRDITLYKRALIHRSISKKLPSGVSDNNERLEYLGDAVISTVVAQYLFSRYTSKREGFLSQMRSKLVSRHTLNTIAKAIQLEQHIVMRQGISITENTNLYGNTIEALIGALFIDKGYNCASDVFINRLLLKHVDFARIEQEELDYKSRLIEWGQKNKQPIIFSSEEDGRVSLARKQFKATVELNSKLTGEGVGFSKKEAEQEAAKKSWEYILATE